MQEESPVQATELTADEQALIAWYRQLDAANQQKLMKMVSSSDTPANKTRRGVWAGIATRR